MWPDDVDMNRVNALYQIRDVMRHLKRDLASLETSVKCTFNDNLHCAEIVRSCPKMVDQFFYHFRGLSDLADTFEEWSMQALEELKR